MSRRSLSRSFPFVRFPCGDMRYLSVILSKSYLLPCPTHGHLCPLIYSTKSVTCVIFLSHMFLFVSWYAMLLSIFVCAIADMVFIYLTCECPCLRAVFHWLKYARVVDLCLQAGSRVTLEEVAELGEYCPSGSWFFIESLGVSYCLLYRSK